MIGVTLSLCLLFLGSLAWGRLIDGTQGDFQKRDSHSAAVSLVGRKLGQIESLAPTGLGYCELAAAGVVDPEPKRLPYRFETVERLARVLPDAQGTVRITPTGNGLSKVTIRVSWGRRPGGAPAGSHQITSLVGK